MRVRDTREMILGPFHDRDRVVVDVGRDLRVVRRGADGQHAELGIQDQAWRRVELDQLRPCTMSVFRDVRAICARIAR
jgi:hypothetical protein